MKFNNLPKWQKEDILNTQSISQGVFLREIIDGIDFKKIQNDYNSTEEL